MAIESEQAERLAREWIEAWNARDLDRVLAHYAADVEFTSPFVTRVTGQAGGTLRGREALRAHFARAFERYPELRFETLTTLAGVRSVTLYYTSVEDLVAAEVMELDGDGRVFRVQAHYAPRASARRP